MFRPSGRPSKKLGLTADPWSQVPIWSTGFQKQRSWSSSEIPRKATDGACSLPSLEAINYTDFDQLSCCEGAPHATSKDTCSFKKMWVLIPFAERWRKFLLEPWREGDDSQNVTGNGSWACEIISEILQATETSEVAFVICMPTG